MTDQAKYSPVTSSESDHDDHTLELTEATAVFEEQDLSHLYVDQPVKTVDTKYARLSEVKQLTWTDSFFDDEDDTIAVFDFDYDQMENFYTSMGWVAIGSTLLYTPFFVASLFGLAPCFLRQNVRWSTRSQHVAITRDGIRFVRDKRPSCWGLACTDQGKSSKTVPFDKITDCDVSEPAGNSCLCVPNVLTVVNVDTASSGTDGKKELRLAGLKNPHGFKKLVWAMKRSQQQHNGGATTTANSMSRGDNNEEMTSLLREIRDELRSNNELLLQQQENQDSSSLIT